MFEDEIDALQLQVDKLITLGVNKIIALGHSGFVTDKEIARRVKGVDVVIGGHSNTFLYTGMHNVCYRLLFLFTIIVASHCNSSEHHLVNCHRFCKEPTVDLFQN